MQAPAAGAASAAPPAEKASLVHPAPQHLEHKHKGLESQRRSVRGPTNRLNPWPAA